LPGGLLSVIVAIGFTPWLVNRLGMRLTTGIGLLCMATGIALFAQIGLNDNYVGIILPSMILVIALGMGIGYPALHIAAVSGFDNKDQGLAAGLQGTSEQVGGGLWLAITTVVVTASMGSTLTDAAQLSGFRAGLYVAAAGAAGGALIALIGIRMQSETASDASVQEVRYLKEENNNVS
jgi:sugar phosphate permease